LTKEGQQSGIAHSESKGGEELSYAGGSKRENGSPINVVAV